MPRRALRCVVDLHVHAVSAPGVWLPSKEPVYLSISLFNQYRNTECYDSVFPLLVNEKFRFEKTYYTAVDPAQVAEILEDELIIFELVQLSEYTDGAVRLASYSTNARDFLYPYPCLAPSYSSHDREILLCRTIAFPGISPKLEFSTKTVIKECMSSALDALENCEDLERKSRRSSRTRRTQSRIRQEGSGIFTCGNKCFEKKKKNRMHLPEELSDSDTQCSQSNIQQKLWEKPSAEDNYPPHYCMPTVTSLSRSRSPSPTVRRKLAEISLDDTIDPRPPFVVRKLDDSLIGRIPSSSTERHAKSRAKRSGSPQRPRSSSALDSLNLSTSTKPRYHLTKVIRKPYEEPLPVFKSHYSSAYDSDIDKEVEELTSRKPTYVSPRPRSVSPFLYRRSFRDRYGDSYYSLPYSPSYYDNLYKMELERARARRLTRLYSSYYDSLDDLDLDLRLARIRAARL